MNYIVSNGKRVYIPKFCCRCEQDFYDPLNQFHKHPRKKDGLQSICKACMKSDNRRYKREQAGKAEPRYGLRDPELTQLVNLQIQHLQEIRGGID